VDFGLKKKTGPSMRTTGKSQKRKKIMPTAKKRPSKTAKAAAKKLAESKLLAAKKSGEDTALGDEFKPGDTTTKTAPAIKQRPQKKRG
jgi:hypothetical protein